MLSWLQNLDIDLFRFINGTLSNPVLDRAMPFISGNVFFAPALVVLGAVLIWKSRGRGVVCLVMIGLVVLTPIPQVAPASWLCVTVADQKPAPVVTAGTPTPDEFLKLLRVTRFVAVV